MEKNKPALGSIFFYQCGILCPLSLIKMATLHESGLCDVLGLVPEFYGAFPPDSL